MTLIQRLRCRPANQKNHGSQNSVGYFENTVHRPGCNLSFKNNNMYHTGDLHIEEEILPLFDYTYNRYSAEVVRQILTEPSQSKAEILYRQQILQGFIANRPILQDYSYSRFNLSDIHTFLESFSAGSFFSGHLRRKLMFSEKERNHKRGKLIMLIQLFHKIQTTYFSKLNTKLFPDEYARELERIHDFFTDFNLAYYQSVFLTKKLKIRHLVALMKIITEKVTNGQAALFWKHWYLFEAHLSISDGIIRHGFTFPVFDDALFSIQGLYHPLVKNPVPNDLIAHKNVLLLTGPNMSGKSTLLKSVSLCVYLGHIGLAVPASKSTLPYFSTISVAINLTDSIVSGYSHFMSEIVALKSVLIESAKDERCFAVFDELFRGTNIEDALEISRATLKGLVKFPRSYFIISTHLHQLKDMEEIKQRKIATSFIDCELQGNIPRFTFKLKDGWSDLKLGRILFEKEGLYTILG
jgi:DNA mismatch repair protein MutS